MDQTSLDELGIAEQRAVLSRIATDIGAEEFGRIAIADYPGPIEADEALDEIREIACSASTSHVTYAGLSALTAFCVQSYARRAKQGPNNDTRELSVVLFVSSSLLDIWLTPLDQNQEFFSPTLFLYCESSMKISNKLLSCAIKELSHWSLMYRRVPPVSRLHSAAIVDFSRALLCGELVRRQMQDAVELAQSQAIAHVEHGPEGEIWRRVGYGEGNGPGVFARTGGQVASSDFNALFQQLMSGEIDRSIGAIYANMMRTGETLKPRS